MSQVWATPFNTVPWEEVVLPTKEGEKEYVNSMWEIQKIPFKGDVLNAYNDGKNESGTQLGQFYELESSSPAIALKRNQSLRHTQRTFHFLGNENQLNKICKQFRNGN